MSQLGFEAVQNCTSSVEGGRWLWRDQSDAPKEILLALRICAHGVTIANAAFLRFDCRSGSFAVTNSHA
jgi:hypothetical protein